MLHTEKTVRNLCVRLEDHEGHKGEWKQGQGKGPPHAGYSTKQDFTSANTSRDTKGNMPTQIKLAAVHENFHSGAKNMINSRQLSPRLAT